MVQHLRRAAVAFAMDSIDLARDHCVTALESSVDVPMMRPSLTALLARCHVRLGQPSEAAAVLDPVLGDPALTSLVTYHPVLLASAEIARAEGEWEAALRAAEDCGQFSARMGTENPVVIPWHPVAAEALEAMGRDRDATRVARAALEVLDGFGYAPQAVRRPLREVCDRLRRPDPAPVPARQIQVIGEPTFVTDRSTVQLRDDLVDHALRFVAVHDRPVLREELTEALWPGLDPATGRHRLRRLLSRLRARHGDVVVRRGAQLAIDPEIDVDLRTFDHLARDALSATDSAVSATRRPSCARARQRRGVRARPLRGLGDVDRRRSRAPAGPAPRPARPAVRLRPRRRRRPRLTTCPTVSAPSRLPLDRPSP